MQFGIIETGAKVETIIDFKEVSQKGILIDFTSGDGATKRNALVWHLENGHYKVEYEWPDSRWIKVDGKCISGEGRYRK